MAKKDLTLPPNVFRTQVVGTGLLLAFIFAMYMFFVSPRLSEPAKISLAKASALQAKGELDKQYAQLQGLKALLPAAAIQNSNLALKFPSDTQSIAFQSQINTIAASSGISANNLQQISIGTTTFDASGTSGSISVEIDVTGSYSQIASFLNKLYTIPRGFGIQGVSLSATQIGKSTSQYTAKINGNIFILKPVPPLPPSLLK